MSWPSVGTFGILLAVLGAIVSILEFHGWKRWAMALVFMALGAGEYKSIRNADRDHLVEVQEQKKALGDEKQSVESLRALVQTNEIKNAGDLAYLRAKLEDSEKLNQLYAPAIKQLAQTGADYFRKQYEAKVITDTDLYKLTMDVVAKIRAFSQKYKKLQSQLFDQSQFGPNTPEPERRLKWEQQTQQSLALSYTRDNEFRASILPDAIYVRQELLKKKLAEPVLSPIKKAEVNSVLGDR